MTAEINIVGLDPSLTHTAAWHGVGPLSAPELRSFAVKSEAKSFAHPVARLASIRDRLIDELGECTLTLSTRGAGRW